jgi:hypothetical protein
VSRLLVTASVVPSSPILVTLTKEALSSFETSFLTRATRRNIPEEAILLYIDTSKNKTKLIQGDTSRYGIKYLQMQIHENTIPKLGRRGKK